MIDRIIHRKDFRRELSDILAFMWKDGERYRVGDTPAEGREADEPLPIEPPRV